MRTGFKEGRDHFGRVIIYHITDVLSDSGQFW